MEVEKLLKITVEALAEKKAKDMVVIDVSRKSSFTDYLILASGGSLRQLNAIVDEVEDVLAEHQVFPKNVEGKKHSDWILLDCGDVIVNVLTDEARSNYNIEKVWGDCDTVPMERITDGK